LGKTAYLDNNLFVDIEQNSLSVKNLLENIDQNLTDFFYSASHLQEANEMTAETNDELNKRLINRFQTITSVTNNNYLFQELPSNKVHKLKEKPNVVYNTINDVPFAKNMMKGMISTVSEEQKAEFRKQLKIDPKRMNNY
jgi:plasmid maintenance system killer protein